ncbi:MAG: response regulator, partial [Deltaproteobacteria bacterium]|nr:response regulator [Deltaproteobacteria bacterium]
PKNITIQRQMHAGRDLVLADPTQIHQILMNLCTNAAQSMREQGGILTVSLSTCHCDAAASNKTVDVPPGSYLKLSVTDTGSGISKDVMQRIFDPYFTTKKKGEGTGLGLSVVHGIAKSHGGTIAVAGEIGKGATFNVYLPQLDMPDLSATVQQAPIPAGRGSILFVDDEEALVDVGQEMLEEFGYEVETKTNALEALEAFQSTPEKFDLVITDKSMPHMTGFDLAEELFRIRPNIPVILCTGYSDSVDTQKAKSSGFSELVTKPIIMRDMAATVKRVLESV